MNNVTLEHGIEIESANKLGAAHNLMELISNRGHENIKSFWGEVQNGKGHFSVLAENIKEVEHLLKGTPFLVKEETEVLVIRVPDKCGSLAQVTQMISDAGVDIKYIYTAQFEGKSAIIVSTLNNAKALTCLKKL